MWFVRGTVLLLPFFEWFVQEASALTGEGLRDGLQWLVAEIRRSDRAALLRQRL